MLRYRDWREIEVLCWWSKTNGSKAEQSQSCNSCQHHLLEILDFLDFDGYARQIDSFIAKSDGHSISLNSNTLSGIQVMRIKMFIKVTALPPALPVVS